MENIVDVGGVVVADNSMGHVSVESVNEPSVSVQSNDAQGNGEQAVDNLKPLVEAATPRGTVLRIIEDPVTGRKRLSEVPITSGVSSNVAPESKTEEVKESEHGADVAGNDVSIPRTDVKTQQGLVPAALTTSTAQVTPYSMEELGVALQMGVVDENRLTGQQAISYGQYKERMAQQKALANADQQVAQPTQEQERASRVEFLRQVDEIARSNAMNELGLTKEDFDVAEYGDDTELKSKISLLNTAIESNRQRILAEVEMERSRSTARANAQKEIINNVNTFADNELAKEPKYKEINEALLTYCDELPRKVGERYRTAALAYQQGTITTEQVRDLEEYYNETKKMVYARANKLSATPQKVTKPPVVEKVGSGQSISQRISPSDLSSMNVRQRQEWFRNNFK